MMEHHDDKLREMMKMAKVEMPFADFEERLMSRIEKVEREKAAVAKTRKYALLCFALCWERCLAWDSIICLRISSKQVSAHRKR